MDQRKIIEGAANWQWRYEAMKKRAEGFQRWMREMRIENEQLKNDRRSLKVQRAVFTAVALVIGYLIGMMV